MSRTPLEVGLTPWRDDGSGSAALHTSQAERAEELGFHSYWLPESHFVGEAALPAPLLLLAAVAARTSRLKLATTSYLLTVRHAIHVAEEIAVLDRLSNGRVILGAGRGFRSALFKAFDVPEKEKRHRFGLALELMTRAWRGEPVAFEGEMDERPVRLAPLPVQKPHPPIWVAGFGPKALAQVGGLGLPYLASPMEPLPVLIDNYARHREAIPPEVQIRDLAVPVMRTVFISHSEPVVERVRKSLAEQNAALAQAGAASLRRAAGADIDSVALVGTPEQVAEGIHRYREQISMTHLVARLRVPGASEADIENSLELLAELRAGNTL